MEKRTSKRSVEWLGKRWRGTLGLDGFALVAESGQRVHWTPEETMGALDILQGRVPVPNLASVSDPVRWARVVTAATAIHKLWGEEEEKDGTHSV